MKVSRWTSLFIQGHVVITDIRYSGIRITTSVVCTPRGRTFTGIYRLLPRVRSPGIRRDVAARSVLMYSPLPEEENRTGHANCPRNNTTGLYRTSGRISFYFNPRICAQHERRFHESFRAYMFDSAVTIECQRTRESKNNLTC